MSILPVSSPLPSSPSPLPHARMPAVPSAAGLIEATTTSSRRRLDGPHLTMHVAESHEEFTCGLEVWLDEIQADLVANPSSIAHVHQAMEQLFSGLRERKLLLPDATWRDQVQRARNHALLGLVRQDPFTGRAANKPRGYAGDAVMMDYIYGREEGWERPAATPLGESIFDFTTSAAASAGVRARREQMANLLDEVALERPSSRVLAVAAGHLREASMSAAVRRRRFSQLVALDADTESLAELHRSYGRFGVEPVACDIRKLLTGRTDLGQFDLIYSTGLYDYLNAKTGSRLTSHLFDMLNPGGRLVVANFLPAIADIGYMEAYMDWFLIYRDRHDMMQLTNLIDQAELDDIRVWVEEHQNIVFLSVTKQR